MSLERYQASSNATKDLATLSRWNRPVAEVREAAYYIWEKEGRPAGREMDHWLRAEAQVRTLRNACDIRNQTS
jgi:hypothetical protein